MADASSYKTGRLVVRYHAPWRRRAVFVGAILGALIFVYGTYEWGRFHGGYSVFAMMQERRDRGAEIDGLKKENAELRGQLAAAETARRIEHQSYGDVEKSLGELQTQLQKQRDELTFYRGIVAPEDGVGALKVQRIDILPDGTDGQYRLRLVLMQSMSRDSAVSGSVKIEFEGTREKQPVRLTLADLGGQTRPGGELTFSFRYFQNIEQNVKLPAGFEPTAIDVEVRGGQQQPSHQSFPWVVKAPG